jgi:hypothetical protein
VDKLRKMFAFLDAIGFGAFIHAPNFTPANFFRMEEASQARRLPYIYTH